MINMQSYRGGDVNPYHCLVITKKKLKIGPLGFITVRHLKAFMFSQQVC
jgi:hypothetical protein